MASLTLAGQQITNNDMLIKGIIESIVTVNQFYQMPSFQRNSWQRFSLQP